jgi:hypothetical protein
MRKISVLLFLICLTYIQADNEISINFFIHPQFSVQAISETSIQIQESAGDSCLSVNVFAGDIFYEAVTDSLFLEYLGKMPGLLYSPDDFLHNHGKKYPSFGMLASNISSDSVTTVKKFKLSSDSLKVGIFSIYTPDLAVKKNFAEGVVLHTDVFAIAREQVDKLKESGCDHIIMLTSLSRFVVNSLVKVVPVNTVVSFDYQREKDGKIRGAIETEYYYVNSSEREYGRLKVKKRGEAVISEWQKLRW